MSSDDSLHDQSLEAVFGQIAGEFTDRTQRGEQPDVEDYARRYPELADLLREVLPALGFVQPPLVSSPAHAVQPTDAGERLGDFRLVREVGRGGMGVVYEAEQILLGRRVALKVLSAAATLDERRLQRFQHEAQAAAHLDHPNIVPVHAVGCAHGVHFYAMQFIDGQTLAAVIHGLRQKTRPSRVTLADGDRATGTTAEVGAEAAAASPVPVPAADATTEVVAGLSTEQSGGPKHFRAVARLGIQAAEALEYAHQMGVIHRDVKPANLLVDERGHLWVTDFGLARFQSDLGLTVSGALLGTVLYMSPEQAAARHHLVDQRTDVYSLGATLYELLTLEPVFDGQDRERLLQQIASADPRPPRRLNARVPRDLETIVLKTLAKEPAQRYTTAQELADDLRRFLDNQPILARRPLWRERLQRWARRHQAAVVAAAAVLVVAVAALTVSTVLVAREADRARREQAEAQEQRQQALTNFRMARDAVDEMLTRVGGERLRHLPQMEGVRRELLQKALVFYQAFLLSRSTDPDLRLETGKAYVRVGEIQTWLGDDRAAERSYDEALALLQELAAQFPAKPEYRNELSHGYLRSGALLQRLWRLKEAAAAYQRVADLQKELAADFPAVAEHRQQLAASHNNLGDLLQAQGQPVAAERAFRQALALQEALAAAWPLVLEYRHQFAISHAQVGSALRSQGRNEAAEQALQQALDLQEKLVSAAPLVPEYRAFLAEIQTRRANVQEGLGRLTVAVQILQQNSATLERLVEEFPAAPDYRHKLSLNYSNLSNLLRRVRQFEAAEQALQRALPMQEKLAAEVPHVPAYRANLARSLFNLGLLSRARGQSEAAVQAYQRALTLFEQLVAEQPLLPEYQQGLAGCHTNLGNLLLQGGEREAAEQAHRQALALKVKLVAAHPTVPAYRQEASSSHRNLAAVLQLRGRFQEAGEEYRHAVKLVPNDPAAQTDLAWFLATCPVERLRDARQALALAEKAVQRLPQDGRCWRIVGVATYRAGDWKAASAALDKAWSLSKGSDGVARLFLAMAHWQLGELEQARTLFAEAVKGMSKPRPGDADLRRFRAEAAALLGLSESQEHQEPIRP